VSRQWLILMGLAGLAVLIPALAVPFVGHAKAMRRPTSCNSWHMTSRAPRS